MLQVNEVMDAVKAGRIEGIVTNWGNPLQGFNDHMKLQPMRRKFKTLHDTRDMDGNGAEYLYCIPTTHDFGCAVTGIKDETGSLLQVRSRPRPVDPSFPFPFRRDEFEEEAASFPIAVVYWMFVLFVVGGVSLYYFFTARGSSLNPNNLWVGGMIALFCLPAIQLAASLLTVAVAAAFYIDKPAAMIRVGKITLWSVLGSLAGILLMLGLCGVTGALGGMFK